MSESDCNIVNATTELNYEDDIKPSVNVKEAGYFNTFECRRNLLDKHDVTYQRSFTASEKTSREVSIATRNRTKQKKPSPVASPVASSYEYPMTERYWKMQETILTEKMAGKDKGLITEPMKILTERMIGKYKDILLKAVSLLKHIDEEDHARTLERLIHQYDEHVDTYE